MTKRLAFLGPPGSFTEQAALDYDPGADLIPYASAAAAVSSVEKGAADEAVVAIENSLGGSVTDTLDLLIHDSSLFIRGEVVLRIEHCLLAAPGTSLGDVKVVYSHPQALTQCRAFLGRHLPEASLVASLSTSAAVEDMKRAAGPAAAIANERTAALYGAVVLERGVQDDPNNLTRFVILAATDHLPTGSDKTSLCFSFDQDGPGLLHGVLGEFAQRNINLVKVESRPTRMSLGRYVFLVALAGHRQDRVVRQALEAVGRRVSMLKTFGSYPRHTPSPPRGGLSDTSAPSNPGR